MSRWIVTALLCAAIALPAQAQELDKLAWMAGHWVQKDAREEVQENWIGPRGNMMVATNLTMTAGRGPSFEFLRIESGADGVAYVAQPGGQPPTRFALIEQAARRVVFANPAHDFPQRILYWLDEAGALHARVEGPKGGKTVGQEWTWTKRPAQ